MFWRNGNFNAPLETKIGMSSYTAQNTQQTKSQFFRVIDMPQIGKHRRIMLFNGRGLPQPLQQ